MGRTAAKRTARLVVLAVMLAQPHAHQDSRGAQRAPDPNPQTIRVRVNLVPVDVVVTDEHDRPVLDLSRDDFVLTENGRVQEIRHFSLERLPAALPAAGTGREALLRKVPTAELSTPTRRTFLILMGRGMFQVPFRDVDNLIEFVRKQLLPQDLVAVYAYNRATDFTTDHEKIAQVLERYRKAHEKIEARLRSSLSGLAAVYGSRGIPKGLQPDIDRIFGPTRDRTVRQVPPAKVPGAQAAAAEVADSTADLMRAEAAAAMAAVNDGEVIGGAATEALQSLDVNSLTDLSFDEFVSTSAMTFQDLQNLYTAIEYLRFVDGEKHLIFFSQDGLYMPRMELDKSLAAMANDARVSIDTFQTGGVSLLDNPFTATAGGSEFGRPGAPQNPKMSSTSRASASSSLRQISQLTGGRYSIHADVGKMLGKLSETTRATYLLGYYPAEAKWDGGYRRINVTVKRAGLLVLFRRGYYARDSVVPYDREEFLSYSRIVAAAGYGGEVKDIIFDAATETQKLPSGQAVIRLALAIHPAAVRFRKKDGIYQGKLRVALFTTDETGHPLDDLWQTVALNLGEESFQRILKSGIPYTAQLPLRQLNQSLKIVLYSSDFDKVGSRVIGIR